MPSFAYSAINAQGNTLTGEVQATDLSSARDALRGDGLLAQWVEERRVGSAGKESSSGGLFNRVKAPKPKSLQVFSRQFATMIEAGLSVVSALVILEQQTDDDALGSVIVDVRELVEGGALLSEAMATRPEAFNRLYCSMVEVAAEWPVSTPAAEGLDAAKIRSAISKAKTLPRIQSLLVVRNGTLVVEEYFNSNHRDSLNDVRSVTKSVLSTLIGAAAHRGIVPTLEAPLSQSLPALWLAGGSTGPVRVFAESGGGPVVWDLVERGPVPVRLPLVGGPDSARCRVLRLGIRGAIHFCGAGQGDGGGGHHRVARRRGGGGPAVSERPRPDRQRRAARGPLTARRSWCRAYPGCPLAFRRGAPDLQPTP